MPEVGDHYRSDEGIYRVVGTGETVTLLRVTDSDGRRRHTGEVCQASRQSLESEFVPADDPDAGFTPLRSVENALQGLYWSVRKFLP